MKSRSALAWDWRVSRLNRLISSRRSWAIPSDTWGQREVVNRQQVYSTLVQSYEQARITEVRDTPVITVLQSPFLPPEPDGRGLTLSGALGLVLGGMVGVVLAFLVEVVQRPMDGSDPARRDFQEAWAGLKRSLPFGGKA
jgi:hypothetical protein